jgi:hypothetical protein
MGRDRKILRKHVEDLVYLNIFGEREVPVSATCNGEGAANLEGWGQGEKAPSNGTCWWQTKVLEGERAGATSRRQRKGIVTGLVRSVGFAGVKVEKKPGVPS